MQFRILPCSRETLSCKEEQEECLNGRIMEIEGLDLFVEEAFELTDSSAERSAEAAVIEISVEKVSLYLKDSISILNSLLKEGYSSLALETG